MSDDRAFPGAGQLDLGEQRPHRGPNGEPLPGFHRNLLVIFPDRDSGFLKILKNAQSAISRCVSDTYPEATSVWKNETRDYPEEITVLFRNPRDRTESLYRMASMTSLTAVRNGKIPHPNLGFEDWVLELLGKPLINDHAIPQMELAHNEDGRYLPTMEFFFDRIPDLMDHYGMRMVSEERQNRSLPIEGLVWTPEMERLHREVYNLDWDKWESRTLVR